MYQSEVIKNLVSDKEPPVYNKEAAIKDIVNRLESYQYRLSSYFLDSDETGSCVVTGGIIGLAFCWAFNFEDQKAGLWFVGFCSLAFTSLITWLVKRSNKKSYGRNLRALFNELSSKPFECRTTVEKTPDDQKALRIKFIVESNLVAEGGHVTKEKNQHYTTYFNPKSDVKSVVKHMLHVVEKAEQFK